MGVTDGQPVDAANTNPAFLDANGDDTALGRISLNDTVGNPTESGPAINNIQREHNSIASFVGKAINVAKDILPSWLFADAGTPTDNLFQRADALTAKFNMTTGHAHTGAAGQGAPISAPNLSNVPLRGYFQEGTLLTGVTGGSKVVTTEMSGKTPSTGSLVLGVVTTAPYNRVVVRDTDGQEFVDGSGNEVYGRLTESVGVWTLSFFVDLAGVETAYSFGSTVSMKWFYQELFNPMVNPPVYDPGAFIPSDAATADVVDASSTQRGVVSTGVQSFAGEKTFDNDVNFTGDVKPGMIGDNELAFKDQPTQALRGLALVKGSLVSADGSAVPTALGVGTNGQVLAADSTETTGLKWVTPATGANQTLSNLTNPTAINQDLLPATDQARSIGSSLLAWLSARVVQFLTKGNVVAFVGDVTASSPTITAISDTSALNEFQSVVGTGIPQGSYILSKTANSVTLNQNATTTTVAATLQAAFMLNTRTDSQTGSDGSGAWFGRSGATVNGKSGAAMLKTGDVSGSGDSGDIQLVTGSVTSGVQGLIRMLSRFLVLPIRSADPSDFVPGGIYWNTVLNKFRQSDGTQWKDLSGSGSGGGINYISNPGFEDGNVNGWTGYDDGASSRPVNGTGGTATGLTMTASSTTPLRDTYSALIAKDAANRQGKGHSFDFSIAREDRFSILSIEVPALVTSGSYNPGTDTTDSDLIAYLYDVTNARLIEPSGFRVMANSTFPTRNRMTFQATDSTSYRLIFHVATTSASAWTMQVDDISVGPQVLGQGSPAQYLGALPTTGAWNTNTTYVGKYWRTADGFLEADVAISLSGAPNALSLFVNLPIGLQIDDNKLATITSASTVGYGKDLDSGSTIYRVSVKRSSSTAVDVLVSADTGAGYQQDSNSFISNVVPQTFAAGDVINIKYRVPIVGWEASTIASSAAALPVIAAKYSLTSNETTAANSDHIMTNFTTKVYDKSGAVSGSTFTAQEPGLYRFTLKALTTSVAWAATDVLVAWLGKNGGTQTEMLHWDRLGSAFTDRYFFKGTAELELNARDTIQLNIRNNTGGGTVPVIDSVGGLSTWEIEKLPSRQQIAASETMLVRASGSTTTVNNTTPTVIFPTVNKSTHGSAIYNPSTGIFTVQAPGDIEVSAFIRINAVAWAVNDAQEIYIFKNGSQYSFLDRKNTEAAGTRLYALSGSDVVPDCVQGDQIEIRAFSSVSSAINSSSYVVFKRLGGVG